MSLPLHAETGPNACHRRPARALRADGLRLVDIGGFRIGDGRVARVAGRP